MTTNLIMVFITTKDGDEAKTIAEALLNDNLCACINIVPSVTSIFKWEDKVTKSEEVLCIVKSRSELFSDIEKIVKKIHSYDIPEIIAIPIVQGSKEYTEWVENVTF